MSIPLWSLLKPRYLRVSVCACIWAEIYFIKKKTLSLEWRAGRSENAWVGKISFSSAVHLSLNHFSISLRNLRYVLLCKFRRSEETSREETNLEIPAPFEHIKQNEERHCFKVARLQTLINSPKFFHPQHKEWNLFLHYLNFLEISTCESSCNFAFF